VKSRGAGELEYSVFDFVFNVVQQSLSSVEKSGYFLSSLCLRSVLNFPYPWYCAISPPYSQSAMTPPNRKITEMNAAR